MMETKIDETTLKVISDQIEVKRLENILVERMPLATEGIDIKNGCRFKLYARLSENLYGIIFGNIYKEHEENKLKHHVGKITCKKRGSIVSIETMAGDPDFKHVGNAMHELAFTLYAKRNRIQLEASHNSHYFHYKNGFRLINSSLDAGIKYYLNLVEALLAANGQRIESELDNCLLYLPQRQVQKKIPNLGLSFIQTEEALKELTETKEQEEICLIGEYVMSRAENALKAGPLSLQERSKLLQDIKEEVKQGNWKTPAETLSCEGSDSRSYKILSEKNVFTNMSKAEELVLSKNIKTMQIL